MGANTWDDSSKSASPLSFDLLAASGANTGQPHPSNQTGNQFRRHRALLRRLQDAPRVAAEKLHATANGEFGTRTFQVEWLWEDFAGCVLPSLTQGDPESVWGPGWDDPDAWVLKSLGYGQENYNKAGRSSTSVVEGAFESVEVRSVGY